ncbi:MAG TPA: AtpZ/AtpI family protein [Methyloceanibacter sp.]|nr:AtpZ/AtpI family protein [Methyloceanibacter sp.]
MAGAVEKPGRGQRDRETEAIKRRLHDLEGKVRDARSRHELPSSAAQDRGSAMGEALKLSTEMIAGVAVGGFIGWALDRLFGTAPILMVVFLILGAAAGILNVIRSAQRRQAEAGPLPGKDLPADDDD